MKALTKILKLIKIVVNRLDKLFMTDDVRMVSDVRMALVFSIKTLTNSIFDIASQSIE